MSRTTLITLAASALAFGGSWLLPVKKDVCQSIDGDIGAINQPLFAFSDNLTFITYYLPGCPKVEAVFQEGALSEQDMSRINSAIRSIDSREWGRNLRLNVVGHYRNVDGVIVLVGVVVGDIASEGGGIPDQIRDIYR